MTSTPKKPIHALPLPSRTLQNSLKALELDSTPVAQRRSTTFNPATRGLWARVYPLWSPWPLRVTKQELLEMGVDVDNGGQVSVDDVLKRWDVRPMGEIDEGEGEGDVGRWVGSSEIRMKLEPKLLGISSATLKDNLPHLDVGDAEALCAVQPESTGSGENEARDSLIDIISGRKVVQSKDYGPWSTRYCGHQFGHWAGQLGDGRAISLLETESKEGGRQEIQLKGAGRTPFSRTADGLAVLRSGIREFLGAEAVAALDIPTTRSLALLNHNNSISVARENGPEPPSLLARVAPTFIRIGHFEALNPGKAGHNHHQFFLGGQGWMHDEEGNEEEKGPLGGQGNLEGLRELTEWCRTIMGSGTIEEFAREVVRRNAEMVAGWQVYGWMHGVLNTDNISILGLTIDYGPYAFMDVWDEQHICNHSDPSGLYSYKNQPSRVLWSLDKFITAISPLIGYESIHGKVGEGFSEGISREDVEEWSKRGGEIMKGFEEEFMKVEKDGERVGWMKRFGLKTFTNADNRDIISDFLTHLHTHRVDFNTSLRHLSTLRPSSSPETISSFTKKMLSASIPNPTDEKINDASKDFIPYLKRYCARISQPEEISAWEVAEVEKERKGLKLNGEGQGWEEKREVEMLRSNPAFVLRQWVLEELISKLEETGVEGIEEGRRELARVLDMSTRPFINWSEVGPQEKRLCGLGAKDMLGFQCSCSS